MTPFGGELQAESEYIILLHQLSGIDILKILITWACLGLAQNVSLAERKLIMPLMSKKKIFNYATCWTSVGAYDLCPEIGDLSLSLCLWKGVSISVSFSPELAHRHRYRYRYRYLRSLIAVCVARLRDWKK